jgi:hypothetical protein
MSGTKTRSNSLGSNSSASSSNFKRSRSPSKIIIEQRQPKKTKLNSKEMNEILMNLQTQMASILKNQADDGEESKKIDQIIENQSKISKKIECIVKELNEIKEKTENHDQEIISIKADVSLVKNEITTLSVELNKVRQNGLSNHFSLRGLPSNIIKKDVLEVMSKFCSSVGENVQSDDLKEIYLLKLPHGETVINGAFYDIRKKQSILNKYKLKKPITAEDICIVPENSPSRGKEIIFKNLLTTETRKLLFETRQLCTDYKYKWERNGRVLIKHNDTAPIIEVTSLQKLKEIIARNK